MLTHRYTSSIQARRQHRPLYGTALPTLPFPRPTTMTLPRLTSDPCPTSPICFPHDVEAARGSSDRIPSRGPPPLGALGKGGNSGPSGHGRGDRNVVGSFPQSQWSTLQWGTLHRPPYFNFQDVMTRLSQSAAVAMEEVVSRLGESPVMVAVDQARHDIEDTPEAAAEMAGRIMGKENYAAPHRQRRSPPSSYYFAVLPNSQLQSQLSDDHSYDSDQDWAAAGAKEPATPDDGLAEQFSSGLEEDYLAPYSTEQEVSIPDSHTISLPDDAHAGTNTDFFEHHEPELYD